MSRSSGPALTAENVGFVYKTRRGFLGRDSLRALSDVSFVLARGETLGVIGRNGCGKSTLLRLLAGVYRPDEGRITRHCHRISLLSLGLGFDPELSGRHNAILSSMLLGSSRAEARQNLDAIVAFSELQAFIDKPVKTYSSGMKARLGFSVGLQMKADVLLIDEVLGVGDLSFRDKASEALHRRIHSDMSVVLVSHSLPMVEDLCDRILWLDRGELVQCGEPEVVTESYRKKVLKNND